MKSRLLPSLLCLAVAACGGPSPSPAPSARESTLVIAAPRDIDMLDPAATLIANNFSVIDVAYDSLLAYEVANGGPTGRLLPALARTVTESPDGLTWTAVLEPGRKFDDGTEVTADAVKFTFDRVKKLRLGPSQALTWLEGVDVTGRHEVRFRLSQRVPFFDQILASPGASILNPKIMQHEQQGDLASQWLSRNTAGSGPYRVVANDLGERLVMERNPHAATPGRGFDRVVFRTVRNETERLLLLEKGDVDLVDGISADQVKRLEQNPNLRVLTSTAPMVLLLNMNNEKPPFDDRRVREAVSLSIDRESILSTVEGGRGRILAGVLPPGVPGHDPSLPPARHDADAARRLLAGAGVKPGTKITFTLVSDRGEAGPAVLAILDDLREIGFDVTLRTIAASARQEIYKGDFQLTLQAINLDFPDPWILFTFVFDSRMIGTMGNMSRYRNPELDALLRRADAAPADERAALYRDAQKIVLRDQPIAVLWQPGWSLAFRRDLEGLNYNFATPYLYNVAGLRRAAAPAGAN